MDKKPNNPPAFPLMGYAPEDNHPVEEHGMSLRDYFAAKAMQGAVAHYGLPNRGDVKEVEIRDAFDSLTEGSYATADAMLKQREVDNG